MNANKDQERPMLSLMPLRYFAAGASLIACAGNAAYADFNALDQQLLTINSIYMTASVEVSINLVALADSGCDCENVLSEEDCVQVVTLPQQDSVMVRGSLIYIASGDNYRLSTRIPPTDIPGTNTDVSFVDNLYTYVDHDEAYADRSTGIDRGLMGMVMEMPIFAPYEHLAPIHEERPDAPHLKSLQNILAANQLPAFQPWQGVTHSGVDHFAADVQTHASQGANGIALRVLVSLDEIDRPKRFERHDPTTSTLRMATNIGHYEEVIHGNSIGTQIETSVWPHFVVHELYTPNGVKFGEISMVVRTLLVNDPAIDQIEIQPPIPAGFRISQDGEIIDAGN